jgi:hypothetical protein
MYKNNYVHLPTKKIDMQLFEDDWGVDNSPPDNTEITTTILYFSKEELATFKALCKIGMKKTLGDEAQTKGNLSDFLINTLNQLYGNVQTKESADNTTS